MKTNIVDALERNGRAGEKWIEPKSPLTALLLICVSLTVGGCAESLEPNNPVRPVGDQPYYAGGPGFAASLSGRWYHDGKPTSINVEADGRNLMIIDELGRRNSGVANSPRELEIPSLRIKGDVSHGGRRISWTNGTEWTRELHEHGSDFGQSVGQGLSGRWFHDGKATNISVSSDGRNVTITNEQGQSSSGYMAGNELVISSGIRGHVSHGGRRISWTNGTEWRR